jgi:hypothetical protein
MDSMHFEMSMSLWSGEAECSGSKMKYSPTGSCVESLVPAGGAILEGSRTSGDRGWLEQVGHWESV